MVEHMATHPNISLTMSGEIQCYNLFANRFEFFYREFYQQNIMTSLSKSDKSSNSSDDNRQLFPPKLSSNIVLINLSDQNVRIRQRGSLPGFYGCESGALIEDWLDECEKAANLNGWTKQEMLKNFAKHLHGGAKIFHQQELIGIQSFEEWKEAMIMKYKREDKSYYMRKFNELRQETRQPVQEFLALIDSYFVKAYGLAVVTARPLRSVKSLIKINILAKGLLPEIWAEIEQLVCPDDRIPPWGEIVKALKDTEWKLKLLKSKIRLPIKNPERFFKAYIASSAINQVVAGYGVFFNDTKIQ